MNGTTPPTDNATDHGERTPSDALNEAASLLTDEAAQAALDEAGIEPPDEPTPWLLDEAAGARIDPPDTAPMEVLVDNGTNGQKAEPSIAAMRMAAIAAGAADPRVDPVARAILRGALPATNSDQPPARGRTEPLGAWDPVDVAAVLAGDPDGRVEATILRRSDGVGLLYAGQINGLVGEPESLKSWLALVACAQEIEAERHVHYIDLEDNPQSVIRKRLHHDLGVDAARLREFFHYIRPDEPITNGDARERLLDAAAEWSPSLAVVDGVTEALSLHGLLSASDVDVAALATLLTRPLADLGAAVLPVDHVVKDAEQRGRWATGSQHKLSAVGGAAYGIHVVQVARRGAQDGLSRVVVTKDRPGAVRSHATAGGTIAEFHFGSSADGVVRWRLDPPDQDRPPFRPTHLMEQVSRYLEGEVTEQSQAAILRAVAGKADGKKTATRCLVAEGFVVTSDGSRGAVLHRSVRPFRESE